MKNILAAFVITLAAIFPSIASSSPDPIQIQAVTNCKTPTMILREAHMAGSDLVSGMTDQELVLAKEYVSSRTGMAVEDLDFDLIEVYTHPDPDVYILIRYKDGCATGAGLISVSEWDDLVIAVQGTEV